MKVVDAKTGLKYEGQWDKENDIPDGKGTSIWPDGSLYEGQFVKGLASGKGRVIFKNGDVYQGDFAKNRGNGIGKYTFADGSTYDGQIEYDLMHGKGGE